jgi:azurin
MKINWSPIAVLAALTLAGCGQNQSAAGGGSTPPGAPAVPAGPRVVEITAADNMKYSLAAIEAKPGEDIKVVLHNAGTAPKEVMAHNWVLLKAGSDAAGFDSAAITEKANGYIPARLQDEILAHIDLVGPNQSGEVEFTAPAAPGDYPFLCTFPAHYQVGMRGILTVK